MQQSSGDTAEPASLGSCNVNGWTDVGEARPTTEDSGIGQPTPITPAEWSVEREGSTNSVARPTETVHTERSQSPVSVIETQLEADTKSSPSPSNERPESNISFETVDNIDENATDCNSNEDHLNSNECDDENGPVIVVTEPAHEEESVFSADQPKPKYTKPFHIQRILSETDDELERKLTIRKRSLCIKPPDDDAMTTIQRRLDEISEMVTPRTEKGAQLLDELDEPLRAYVLELAKQSPSVFARHRRKEWKVKHLFQYAIRMSLFTAKFMAAAKKYIQTKKKAGKNDAPIKSDEIEDDSGMGFNATFSKNSPSKSSIHLDLQLYLTTQPENRDPEHVRRIIWVLRTTKAFTMFSSEMEVELARRVGYERYDNGRVISYQGKPPDRFYYILSGRVNMLRQYKLQTGEVTKSMGFLTKGKTTDTEEMEKQWRRESNLVCKGSVEVLLIAKKDYFFLQNTDAGPPIDFLRNVDLFREFPCEQFLNHPEAIEFKYYGPNKLVVKDTNTRNWIFIVKSGRCKCVRRQDVVDVSQDKRLSSKQRLEQLGCAKGYSHADAMMQMKLKRLVESGQKNFSLPQIQRVPDQITVSNPHAQTIGFDSNGRINFNFRRRSGAFPPSKFSTPTASEHDVQSECTGTSMHDGSEQEAEEDDFRGTSKVNERVANTDSYTEPKSRKKFHRESMSIELPPLALAGSKDRHLLLGPTRQRKSMFMTQRSKTEPQIMRKRRPLLDDDDEDVPLRRAYLQLDILKSCDMIGLNDLSGLSRAKKTGVSVWSDGAEIIKVNKRFFRQHAGTVTMLKLETMNRDYVTEEDAMQNLEEQETWLQYKTILMKKMSLYHSKNPKTPRNTLST